MPTSRPFIDIFCRVIDNFGDIGVCWRLAKDLHHILTQQEQYEKSPLESPKQATQHASTQRQASYFSFDTNSLYHTLWQTPHNGTIRLWVDNLASFQRIDPAIDANKPFQLVNGITICQWQDSATATPALVVIEAFASNLDNEYIKAMPKHSKYWFNLEYLSAETWVESFHAQPSPQANGMTKYFFFPGFTANTGGLIYEPHLFESLEHFQRDKKMMGAWLNKFIQPSLNEAFNRGDRFISLFCYLDAPILPLLSALLACPGKTHLLVAEGVLPQLSFILNSLESHYPIQEKINLCRFSFMPQEQFDYLLAACDMNIVRGEDSFVRAIWSGKPFLWHIYAQKENAHLLKLHAWLNSYPMPEHYKTLTMLWNMLSQPREQIEKTALLNAFDTLVTPSSLFTHHNDNIDISCLAANPNSPHYSLLLHQLFIQLFTQPHDFHTHYTNDLKQNPNLSFSLLNFQAKIA